MKRFGLALAAVLIVMQLAGMPVLADYPVLESDEELAVRYAPVFHFHPAEVFFPQPVDVIVDQARLRQSHRLWFDVNVLLSLDVRDLLDLESDERHFLDLWYSDDGGSAYANYSAHRAFYQAALSPDAGGPPLTVYAHVLRDADHITVQYWALYYYNDWLNKHEGDWELAQVMLTAEGEPEWVVYGQHHGGTRRAWSHTPRLKDTHPRVYVALGSHANYFAGDEVYLQARDVGGVRVEVPDRTGQSEGLIPRVILIPDRAGLAHDEDAWPGAEWLPFRGHWGEVAVHGDFGGPLGPADQGGRWERPYAWGLAQPLDTDVWYGNRLQVVLVGGSAGEAEVGLMAAGGGALSGVEALGSLAILHTDPPPEGVVASLYAPPGTRWDALAAWPDAGAGQVIRFRLADVSFVASGSATMTLGPDGLGLIRDSAGLVLEPASVEVTRVEASWDAPDVMWLGGLLPAHMVGVGALLAVLAGVLPALAYVGALYWADRYEKEPRRLLLAAFVWGGVPAVLMAAGGELFFRLPPDLLGTQALEAARLGLVAPLLQEALKGLAVFFIAWRYRRELDNVLDGMVYGATVGFGFAMTANVIGYLGSFALQGFEALGPGRFVEGLFYGLDQGLYTAALGAGLGFARLVGGRWRRWTWAAGGFGLAVLVHALHDLLARALLGLNVLTVLTTGAGLAAVVLVAAASLARQRRCLAAELADEVPDPLYRALTVAGGRCRAEWRALRHSGLGGWRGTRRLHEVCAELASAKMHRRLRPWELGWVEEIEQLRREMAVLTRES